MPEPPSQAFPVPWKEIKASISLSAICSDLCALLSSLLISCVHLVLPVQSLLFVHLVSLFIRCVCVNFAPHPAVMVMGIYMTCFHSSFFSLCP